MIHVAIISHGHEDLLISTGIGGLQDTTEGIHVWIKDNRPSARLKAYCQQHAVSYTDASPGLGFGANNNFLFETIQNGVGFGDDDLFIVMNPDVATTPDTLFTLLERMNKDRALIATLNLYRDSACTETDANIRLFPDFLSPVRMLWVRSLTEAYDKRVVNRPAWCEWASGAFLAFRACHYRALQGFDDRYFMYFEDVDLCYRSFLQTGKGVRYYPDIAAVHLAARKNRNIASMHANWFIRSFLKFLFRKYFVYGAPRHGS